MGGNVPGPEPVAILRCSDAFLPEVARILTESPEAAQWSDRALRDTLANTQDKLLVAQARGEVAGFILGRSGGEEAEILNLAVRSQWRRQGIGTALANALLGCYTRERIRRVFLEVRESNRGAIAFYEGFGFQQVGKRPDYYRDPAEAALVFAREAREAG